MVPWQTLLSQKLTLHPFSDFKAYEDAAEEFHPYIPFFATFDSKVLPHPEAILGLPHPLQWPSSPSPRITGGPGPSLHMTPPIPTSGLPHPKDFRLSNTPLSCPTKVQRSEDTCPMSQ